MTDALTHFPPSLTEARTRLSDFAPLAGAAYAARRNFDYGEGMHGSVSTLSPYVRLRLLDETVITRAVAAHHSPQAAEKFLAEVFWRTYWKGWMELRPAVWESYQADLKRLHDDVQTQSGLRQRWEDACLGHTGIAPFDAWAEELIQTGYLHNHARMWFASIWIFTLGLPWQLGADFFFRHLLDGDAAVNTLSWRWVAGIQTRGKTYLATQDNIAKFTGGRFTKVPGLATSAPAQDAEDPPTPRLLPDVPRPEAGGRVGLLLHDDDVDTAMMGKFAEDTVACGYFDTTADNSPWHMAPHVSAFRTAAAQDAAPSTHPPTILTSVEALDNWAKNVSLDQIVAPYATVGTTRTALDQYARLPDALPVNFVRRALDTQAWPLATKGFFPFKKHIPDLIKTCLSNG